MMSLFNAPDRATARAESIARIESVKATLAFRKEERERLMRRQVKAGTHLLVYCGKHANYIIYE